jgi:hypothetical protein
MPACYIDGVALQPPCSAGVVLPCADMVSAYALDFRPEQPCAQGATTEGCPYKRASL